MIRFGRLFWGVLVFAAAWSLLAVLFTWSPVALAVPLLIAGYATAWGALVRAVVAHRRGAWQLLVGLTAIGLLWPVAGRPLSVPTVASLVVHAALLGLLLHRDSREWVGADVPRRPRVEDPGGGRGCDAEDERPCSSGAVRARMLHDHRRPRAEMIRGAS